MYVFLIILLFVGSIMVIDGIYREEINFLKSSKKHDFSLKANNTYDYDVANILDKQFETILKEHKQTTAL